MPRRVDPYAELGVLPTASQDEIQAAFRRLARDHHPDTNADPAAEGRFKRIAHAYEHIKTVAARREWDERCAGVQGRGGRPTTFLVDQGPLYHTDLAHHRVFYMA